MTDNHTRTLTIDRAHAKSGNTFPVTLSTETPYLREYGWEILDHGRVDLSRAPLPLIESHDASQLNIGIVDDLHVDGGKLRGTIRLGKSARAKELAADIKEGIVRNVSIGYQVSDGEADGERDGNPVYRFAFSPHELSLVSAPADINSGIYRSKGKTMETEKSSRSERKRESSHEQNESDRVRQIYNMADAHNLADLGRQGISEGWTALEFNSRALTAVGDRNNKARSESPCDNPQRNDFSFEANRYDEIMPKYSLTRLLRGLADPKDLDKAGLELEISQDMQQTLGRRSKGILVPFEALQQRAVTYGGTGSNLVSTDHMAGSFIDVLRNRSTVMGLNPTVLRDLVGDVAIPRKTAGATAYWIAGDNADSITESDVVMDQVTLSPKVVGGAVTFSHKMIVQSSPDIEQLVRGDLADLIASQIDLKSISGSGASNQPTGILNQTGIGSTTYANGGDPSFADIVALETTIAAANADQGPLRYLTTPAIAGTMKTTDVGTDTGQFVWSKSMMNDLAAYKSGNMTAGYVLLGDWSQLLVGFWGGIEIDADPYGSNFLKGSVTVRVLADVDIGVRHPEAFAEIHETP
jgi:HK97 family phage major capsid protein/HK97 family phage prohead protease